MPARTARAAVAAALLFAFAAAAAPFGGVVTSVTDGDSLWVRPDAGGSPVAIRLQGIDAPEICQPFGREARAALAARALHRPVTVLPRARDRYERLVARVHAGSEDLAATVVRQGYAWSDGWGRRGGPYSALQARAAQLRLGLWAGEAMRPREFRRRHGRCW